MIREHTVCATPASLTILVEDTQINYYYPKACETLFNISLNTNQQHSAGMITKRIVEQQKENEVAAI